MRMLEGEKLYQTGKVSMLENELMTAWKRMKCCSKDHTEFYDKTI